MKNSVFVYKKFVKKNENCEKKGRKSNKIIIVFFIITIIIMIYFISVLIDKSTVYFPLIYWLTENRLFPLGQCQLYWKSVSSFRGSLRIQRELCWLGRNRQSGESLQECVLPREV